MVDQSFAQAEDILNRGLTAVPKHPVLLQMAELTKRHVMKIKEEAERKAHARAVAEVESKIQSQGVSSLSTQDLVVILTEACRVGVYFARWCNSSGTLTCL